MGHRLIPHFSLPAMPGHSDYIYYFKFLATDSKMDELFESNCFLVPKLKKSLLDWKMDVQDNRLGEPLGLSNPLRFTERAVIKPFSVGARDFKVGHTIQRNPLKGNEVPQYLLAGDVLFDQEEAEIMDEMREEHLLFMAEMEHHLKKCSVPVRRRLADYLLDEIDGQL